MMLALRDGEAIIDPVTDLPVRDPAEIEADAQFIRARLAPQPVLGQIKSPDDIIQDLEWAKHLSGRSSLVIMEADKARRAVRRRFAVARAKALHATTAKSADLREADVVLATEELAELVDLTEIAYDFAKAVARSVESSTSAIQTQAKHVEITYRLAGSGRGDG